MMKTLLVTYHSQTGHTQQLAEACYLAANSASTEIAVIYQPASKVGCNIFSTADAYIFATPENFGYMSGELKALFDRTYEDCREQTAGKSYAILISCGNDGSGAKQSVERILNGYKMKNSGLYLVAKGENSQENIRDAQQIGEYMAVALENGII